MTSQPVDRNAFFAEVSCFRELLRGLIEQQKKRDPEFSQMTLAKCAGIKSKSYISDVLSGRRKLNFKYARPLAACLGLERRRLQLFVLMAERENLSAEDGKFCEISERIRVLKKSLSVRREAIPEDFVNAALIFEVFCALFLFDEPISHDQVASAIGRNRLKLVKQSLDQLCDQGFVEQVESGYRPKTDMVMFDRAGDDRHIQFLKSSLQQALTDISKWFNHSDVSYIESCIVSVREIEYKELLKDLRERMIEIRTRMDESHGADRLVRFNLQIYPLK